MSTFLLSNGVCNHLDKLNRKFLWQSDPGKNHSLHLINWNAICSKKSIGGLGIRSTRLHNVALMSKLCWQLAERSQSQWCTMVKNKYFPHATFMRAPLKRTASRFWRHLITVRNEIQTFMCWRIGSRHNLLRLSLGMKHLFEQFSDHMKNLVTFRGHDESIQAILKRAKNSIITLDRNPTLLGALLTELSSKLQSLLDNNYLLVLSEASFYSPRQDAGLGSIAWASEDNTPFAECNKVKVSEVEEGEALSLFHGLQTYFANGFTPYKCSLWEV
ncbi:hypothetical protein IFM89_001917 [Coptis chinensis]|uniref:Uncharacterized protein n=1 Tax=Coptis chinensis TaxID=261450 RepID=A0A835IIQ7_9MAGN|nr:hypothetical protein IFM89_001917 [Coptis chinensis]